MTRKVRFTETTHQWEGKAILRVEGVLQEQYLGVIGTDKKLKETGAKELFNELIPQGTITVEVKKLDDVSITYVSEVEEFKKIATVEEIAEETQVEDEVSITQE